MILLIGYMGAGKTTLGKALAQHLNCQFYDLDQYIEQTTSHTIEQIFATHGESGFRQIEHDALNEILTNTEGVLAVGGGTPCFFDNMEQMNRHAITIYLKATSETLKSHIRMGNSIRPLIEGKDDEELIAYINESLQKREPYYRLARYTLNIDTITSEKQIQHYVAMLENIYKKAESSEQSENPEHSENSENSEHSENSESSESPKPKLTIIKVGGKIVEEPGTLAQLIDDFSHVEGHKMLVHGGGRSATQVAAQMGVETHMVDGRRITDAEMLRIVTMVYAGLVNKTIVAQLQAHHINALGLSGADMNVIRSHKRAATPIDYGFVGDVDNVDAGRLAALIMTGITPVMAPLTHDGQGTMLNTNADTIAGEVAKAMTRHFDVTLTYCFEKKGVLRDENDDDSVIPQINPQIFNQLKKQHIIHDGMIPKLHNAFNALEAGVKEVIITKADAITGHQGTIITK